MQKIRFTFVITAILLVILPVVVLIAINSKQILTGSVKDLNKVDILIPDYLHGHSKRIILEEKEQIEEIYSILVNTNVMFFKKDYEGMQHDRKFYLDLYYSSGKIVKIESTENGEGIFKYEKILSIEGFFIGKNIKLWDYIENIAK